MAMNKFMHPRNPYKRPPDFMQLIIDYPDLRKYVKPDLSGKVKLNFKCEGAVKELTKCLLHKDFSLSIDLPPDRLVPTLPLRMNYLLWIEDLVNESGKQLHGFDIGTGASCIYPLLAVKHFNWKMTATEINQESIKYAVKNVETNNLKDFIVIKHVDESVMLDGALDEGVTYDFCMCNPPFFSNESEMKGKARTERRAPPRNHRTGQDFELMAPGGETAFISRIIQDSFKLKTRIRVYTVMVGQKSNLNNIKEMVKKLNPVKMRTTEFCQGRTTRWGLAWTFSKDSNLVSTALQMRKDQSKSPYRWLYPGNQGLASLINTILNVLNQLSISTNVIDKDDDNCSLCIKAYKNTWSHSRRKRREENRKLIEEKMSSPVDSVVTVGSSVDSACRSPTDSLGYSSLNDLDEEHTTKEVALFSPSNNLELVLNVKNSDKIAEGLLSENEISTNPTNEMESIIENNEDKIQTENFGCSSNIDDSSSKNCNNSHDDTLGDAEEQIQTDMLNVSSDRETISRKRNIKESRSSASPDRKKTKCSDRPLVEAVINLLEFDGDILISFSFVDGTGGRDQANQVFQYLKNKLSS